MFKSSLGILRIVAILEGISFLVLLLIAMPLKYYAGIPEVNQVVGMAHGVLFIAYILMILVVGTDKKWALGKLLLLFFLSLVPLGTFYADLKYFR